MEHNTSKGSVALIEDDQSLSQVLSEELIDNGFEVHIARDGETGIAVVQKHIPDLVLLDLLMPKKNGYEVLITLKNDPKTKHIPVVILSMLSIDDDIDKGLRLGASEYLIKSHHKVDEIVKRAGEYIAAARKATY